MKIIEKILPGYLENLGGVCMLPAQTMSSCASMKTSMTTGAKGQAMAAMDATDRKILVHLQENAAQPVAEIARKVGLSVTPCWRRIQRLEEIGVIRKRVALLDPTKVGVGMSVFVALRTDQHNAEWLESFAAMISEMPEVVEFYRMSGEVDYLLRVVVADMAAYDAFYRRLIGRVQLTDVSSSFAMEEIKFTTSLPIAQDGEG